MGSCGSDGKKSNPVAEPFIDPLIFGINMEWENLGYYSFTGGELLRDRSFRMNHTVFYDLFGTAKSPLWEPYINGGSVTFSTTGGAVPSGAQSYPGYAVISRTSADYSGVSQRLLDGVSSGESFEFSFSAYGVGQSETLTMYLFDVADPGVPMSNQPFVASSAGAWGRHTVTLTATKAAQYPGILIVLESTDATSRTVWLDEMRLRKTAAEPAVKQSVKESLTELGVTSIRWPGGTLVDFFDWESSVGSWAARGEIQAAADYQTPALGLHEFLNLCEETDIEPVIQVNFLYGAQQAEDLVEYILGSGATPQGQLRAANGRSEPWDVTWFEIGNEPAKTYRAGFSESDAALGYAQLVRPVNQAVRERAAALGRSVKISGIIEPSFQLADWLAAVAELPGATYDPVRLIHRWNTHVFGADGFGAVDFLDGHFYGFREYDPAKTVRERYELVVASGATLAKTMTDKIRPYSAAPLMLTEYHLYPEHKDTKVAQVNHIQDFQSGMGIGDILFSLMEMKAGGSHLYSFAHPYFGAVQNTDTRRLRPAGLAFSLLSPLAGEALLPVTADDSQSITIATGSGNVPSGLTYPQVSVIATRNRTTGKARIALMNRSYDTDKTITLSFNEAVSGDADVYLLNNADLTASNESAENVVVTQELLNYGAPFTVSLPAHSMMRIDMR